MIKITTSLRIYGALDVNQKNPNTDPWKTSNAGYRVCGLQAKEVRNIGQLLMNEVDWL